MWQQLQKTMNIQNGLPDGTKPLPSMLTVRSNDIDLRSISQEILQPTITNISFKIVHLNIQFNLTGANQLKINILPIKITKEIYFHKKNFSINTTIDISLLALSVKHHDIPGCAYQVAHVYIPVSTISRPVLQSDNTLKPRQNDQHFADDMFKNVFPILISI